MSDRASTILIHKGQLLVVAAQYGQANAAEHGRGVIDGVFNGLLRIEDSEEVAKFAFAVADRVAGNIKNPTAWPLPKQIEVAPVPAPQSTDRRFGFWTTFAIGWCMGAFFIIGTLSPQVTNWLLAAVSR